MGSKFATAAAFAVLTLAACSHDVPPPPPAPPPPPPPVVHYDAVTVYFDYQKANLTGTAADVIADTLRHGLPRHEVVIGFCDTAERHCDDLGLRRAEAVKDELIRRGMPAGAIETRASADLAVPTPRHVREPQNRRVIIDPR